MKRICAVILVSEQTIPNLMFLKWLFTTNYGGLSELFCVTTEYMEKKNKIKAIQKALGVINSFFAKMTPIIVDENNLEENVKKIELQFSDSVFYDEIQYLKEWKVSLKSLVDTYLNVKFIASGSAAAELKKRSDESGAGRFSDFNLPPLTFYEYIHLKGYANIMKPDTIDCLGVPVESYRTVAIDKLNELRGCF